MPRREDLHEVILRLLAAARAAQEDADLVLHHLDRALQLLGHPGIAPEAAPDYPPEVRAFLAALLEDPGRSAEQEVLVLLGALPLGCAEAGHAVA